MKPEEKRSFCYNLSRRRKSLSRVALRRSMCRVFETGHATPVEKTPRACVRLFDGCASTMRFWRSFAQFDSGTVGAVR